MKNEPTISKAEELLEQLGSLDEVRRYYEAREMAIHDEITRITGAREEGREEGKLEDARQMLLLKMDEALIARITKLSLEQIRKVKSEIDRELQ